VIGQNTKIRIKMSRYNKNSMVALPLVFVSALLIGSVATTQAVNKEAKKINVGNSRTFLDPFSLDVKSSSKKRGKSDALWRHHSSK